MIHLRHVCEVFVIDMAESSISCWRGEGDSKECGIQGLWAPGIHNHCIVLPWYHWERGLAGFSTYPRVVEGKTKASLGELLPQLGEPALRGGVAMHFADQR